MNRTELYERTPVAVQNAMATAYGLKQLPIRHGGEYRRLTREYEARGWWEQETLHHDQDSRLRQMVVWCAARVPYYRELFADLGIEPLDIRTAADLTALPILEKETVRNRPESFVPDDFRGRLVAQTTGGTTGTPLRYWASVEAVRRNYAVYEVRNRNWAGVRLGDRMASFHGQPIVPANETDGPFWRRNLAFNQLYMSVYHLNEANLPKYVDALERFAPRVIVGYTSAVHRVAQHLLARGDVGRLRASAVLVSSETLFPAARRDIEEAFGCTVFNSYSLGELVAYVSQCEHGELHVSTDYGVIELVGPPGGTEIIATGLINKGMPLIRYRTGDLATAAEPGPSSCGRGLPMLSELTGRIDDFVVTPDGATVGPAPMSLAFQKVSNLRRAQVHQDSVDRLLIYLEVAPTFSPDDRDLLEVELRRRLGDTIGLDFEVVESISRTSGGKERLVVSSLGAP